MTNSDFYLTEVQKIADRWEKRYDLISGRSLVFLQINGALLTLLFLIATNYESITLESLIIPTGFIMYSIIVCFTVFFPFKKQEINLSVNFKQINEDDHDTIANSLIYEYQQIIKSIAKSYRPKVFLFQSGIISLSGGLGSFVLIIFGII